MWGRRNRQLRQEEALVDDLVIRWTAACEGAGVVRKVDTVSGPTVVPPRITYVVIGPPTILTVVLPAGLLAEDIRKAAHRIAPHMGCWGLRVEDKGSYAVVTLLQSDPLAENLELQPVDGVLLGRTEQGDLWTVQDFPHVIVQGQTRSGKSSWLYSVLAQWPHEVRGVDPSGITLRPFNDVVLGLSSLDHADVYLSGLVADMDQRLKSMPVTADVLSADPTLIVLEEYPALLRAADAKDTKLGKRIRGHVARLLAESHKVGYRVLIVCQRAEASIVGGAERSQCAGRVSFAVDSLESLKLLHSEPEFVDSPVGVALVTWPGEPTRRIKAPRIPSYEEYVKLVTRV